MGWVKTIQHMQDELVAWFPMLETHHEWLHLGFEILCELERSDDLHNN